MSGVWLVLACTTPPDSVGSTPIVDTSVAQLVDSASSAEPIPQLESQYADPADVAAPLEVVVVYDITRSTRYHAEEMRNAVVEFHDRLSALSHVRVGLVVYVGVAQTYSALQPPSTRQRQAWAELDWCQDLIWDTHVAPHLLDCTAPVDASNWPYLTDDDEWWLAGQSDGEGLLEAAGLFDGDGRRRVVLVTEGQPHCWSPGTLLECDKERRQLAIDSADLLWSLRVDVDVVQVAHEHHMGHLVRGLGTECTGDVGQCLDDLANTLEERE